MSKQSMRKHITLIENMETNEMSPEDDPNVQFQPTTIRLNWNQALALNVHRDDPESSNMPGVFKSERVSDARHYELTVYDLEKFLKHESNRVGHMQFSNNATIRIYNNLVKKLAGPDAPMWISKYPAQGTY